MNNEQKLILAKRITRVARELIITAAQEEYTKYATKPAMDRDSRTSNVLKALNDLISERKTEYYDNEQTKNQTKKEFVDKLIAAKKGIELISYRLNSYEKKQIHSYIKDMIKKEKQKMKDEQDKLKKYTKEALRAIKMFKRITKKRK